MGENERKEADVGLPLSESLSKKKAFIPFLFGRKLGSRELSLPFNPHSFSFTSLPRGTSSKLDRQFNLPSSNA
jgi:hypothetical protein